VAAEALVADVADDAVRDGNDGGAAAGEDVDALVDACPAVPRRVPAVVEYQRYADRGDRIKL
jgi:hypothetical protein